jgi:hypothetical protein
MQDTTAENVQRWHAWRAACESGRDWAEAYDLYLHPATRIELEELLPESVADRANRSPVSVGAAAS